LSDLNPGWRILVLTYNRTLAEDLRGRLREIGGDPERVAITHFHKWCTDALSPSGWMGTILDGNSQLGLITRILDEMPEAPSFAGRFLVDEINWMKDHRLVTWSAYRQAVRRGRGMGLIEAQRRMVFSVFEAYQQRMAQARQLDWGDVPIRVLEAMDAGTLPPAQYHAVLIDEAQDFAPAWFQVALRLLKPDTNLLFIVADGAQKIYRRAFSWASLGIDIRGSRSRVLTRSYRSTYEILKAAYQVIRDGDIRRELETWGEEVIEPEMVTERMPHGPLPVLLRFTDPAREYAHLATEIQRLLGSGYQPGDILVAGRRRGILGELAQTLRDHDIPANVMTMQTPSLTDPSVKVSTLHSAKGLEFRVVFICGLEALNDEGAESHTEMVETEERRLLYVGMTRARERLYISYHGQIPGWVLAALETGIERQ
jgi:superfamily I DNA/RNA helicase